MADLENGAIRRAEGIAGVRVVTSSGRHAVIGFAVEHLNQRPETGNGSLAEVRRFVERDHDHVTPPLDPAGRRDPTLVVDGSRLHPSARKGRMGPSKPTELP
jgi:hypothetical protein